MSERSGLRYTRAAHWPEIRPDSFAATIQRDDAEGCQIALVGVPDDTGVQLNRGRPGARLGPSAFRNALARSGYAHDGTTGRALATRVYDAGDVDVAEGCDELALRETHHRVGEVMTELHARGLVPCMLGGGHDLTYPAALALYTSRGSTRSLAGLSMDAHLDVRETTGSGMPFRCLIEAGALDPQRFAVFGTGPFSNTPAHAAWATERGVTTLPAEHALRDPAALARAHAQVFTSETDAGFVSLCLDAISLAHAPGVSAPNALGLSPLHALELARRAGADARVLHFDVMELSPPHDLAGATAALAAAVFLCFVSEFERRRPLPPPDEGPSA